MLPTNIHERVYGMLLRESRDRPVSSLKDDSPFAPDPHAALASAVANFLAHPETHPKPTPKKSVTLSESYEDITKRFANPIEAAYALLTGRARIGG